MKARWLVLGALVAIVLALLWWRSRDGGGSDSATRGSGGSVAGSGSARGGSAAAPGAQHLPAWFLGRGAPRKIAGRVTYDGAPVAGATVVLHSTVTQAHGGRAPALATGPDGAFDFGAVPIGAYTVSADAVDLIPAYVAVDLGDPSRKPPPDQLELRLRTCKTFVAGTVFDAASQPIPKARVLYAGFVGATTDARGAYKVCLPAGEVLLEYGAEGYGGVSLAMNVQGEHRQDIVLVPEATLVVKVVRAADNIAVPEALVWVAPIELGRDRPSGATAITDAEGKARIDGLVPGQFRVGAFADGLGWENPVVALAEVGKSTEVVVRLVAMARITGVVKNGSAPVPGAQLFGIRKSPAARSQPTTSAADGTFVLERVPVGELVFTAHPYQVRQPTTFKADRAQTYEGVEIDVGTMGVIRGRVTRLGKPLEGINVCCVRTGGLEPARFTDADGRYEFAGVAAGDYELYAEDLLIGAFAHPSRVKLGDNEEKTVDIELDQAGTITGVVVDKDGKPVPGVWVRWNHETTGDVGRGLTDGRGKYRAGAMTGGGKYRAGVYATMTSQTPYPTADGAPYPALEVKDAATTIDDVKLAIDYRQLEISGRVVDTSGAGIADATVKAQAQSSGDQPAPFHPWNKLPITFTDADGKFTLQNLSPGAYALHARSADGGEGVTPNIAAGSTGATVAIARPGSIEGTLAGFPNKPVVYARTLDGSGRFVMGDVEGTTSYRVRGLRAGRYLVGAQTTYEGEAQIVEVVPGATAKLPLTARGRGVIEATVLDFRTKAPIPEVVCHVLVAAGGFHSITSWDPSGQPRSDPRGKLVLDPAPAGNVTIDCITTSFRWSPPSLDLTLAANGRATVQLYSVELKQDNVGIHGLEFDETVAAPRISRVRPNTSGAKAGAAAGDLIVAVNGASVDGVNAWGVRHLIASTPIHGDVTLTVARGGEKKTLTVRLEPEN